MRIKVTGYLDPEEMEPEDVDLGHEYGVSAEFYRAVLTGERPLDLDDLEFEKVEE